MMNKKYLIIALIACLLGFLAFNTLRTKDTPEVNTINTENHNKQEKNNTIEPAIKTTEKQNKILKSSVNSNVNKISPDLSNSEDNFVKNANLYDNIPSSMMPLSAIGLISEVPENIQNKISQISNNNSIYMVQRHKDKLFLVTDNPENLRHSIEFTEISLTNGHQTNTTLGYNDKMQDSDNDIWEYDKNSHSPLRHTKYNQNGDMEFVEVWNYDAENPIKYEMKDAEGHTISMRKETLENGTDLRVEHLVYDKEGNTKINVSATYDGQDIKRFTYYNADKPEEGGAIYSEYSDGQKTKETVYTPDLKVKNSYTSEYKDGTREEIIKWDNENKEVKKYVAPEVK